MERSIEALLKLCLERGMGRHPFLRLTAELPVDMGVLYDFMSNLNLATSAYPAWLQTSCARVPSPKIRSILFKLLNDEYGSGDPEQIHVNLFDDMLGALRPWQLPLEAGEALRPGRELRARAEAIFNARDPYEGLGVVISGEISAEQHIAWLGHQLSRQTHLDPNQIAWYTVHARVEPDHALDSSRLAQLIGEDAGVRASVWRGAEAAVASLNVFLDALLERHYPLQSAAAGRAGSAGVREGLPQG